VTSDALDSEPDPVADWALADTALADTAVADTAVADTAVADTAVEETVRISGRDPDGGGSGLGRPGRIAVVVVLVGLVITGTVALTASHLNRDNEHRLLEVQTRQAGDVLASTIQSIENPLGTALQLESVTDGSSQEFTQYMTSAVGPKGLFVYASLWTTTGSEPRQLASVGVAHQSGADAAATRSFVLRAVHAKTVVVTGIPSGQPQAVAYAFAEPLIAPYVVYAERAIPADRRVSVESNSAFADLRYATYLGATTRSSELATTNLPPSQLPLSGDTARVSVPLGDTTLTLVTSPAGQLGGQLGADLPWIFLVGGTLLTVGTAVVAEQLARRRRDAEEAAGTISGLYQRLDHLYGEQRSIAETLQRALLPQGDPSIPRLEMASRFVAGAKGVDVGGDWYSLFPLGDQGFAFVVGDVSGRGVSAAAVMAKLRFTMQAYLVEGHPPDAVLAMCCRQLDVSVDGHFSTALVGTGDLESGLITLANAGHLPPLVVSTGGARFVPTEVGPPVGVEVTTYQARTITLSPGETLVVFTDGLVERRGEDLSVSLQRLADRAVLLDPDPDVLLSRLVGDLGPDESEDDLAVLAFRLVDGSPATPATPAGTGGVGPGAAGRTPTAPRY
jgi:serine phosphatase RsbU (regulator of sigma subunit)